MFAEQVNLLTFAAGATTQNIAIPILNDTTVESPDETIVINISAPSNATLGSTTSHTYTIIDDDIAPDTTPPTVGYSPFSFTGTLTNTLLTQIMIAGAPVNLGGGGSFSYTTSSTPSGTPLTVIVAADDGAGSTATRTVTITAP